MAGAKQGDVVKVHYTGKLEDGMVFDSSAEREPMEFIIGEGQIIPGFEEAVIGLEPGNSTTTTVPPEKGYGPRRDELVVSVERAQLPEDMDPQVGQRLQSEQEDGQTIAFTVTETAEESITLDANHPLAGKDLTFEIELVEIA